ncbi:MAG: hypothetical protein U0169_01430 [Polyangiaceae bacterium]
MRKVTATDAATNYLVGLLTDYAKPGGLAEETLDRPLAFLLDEALHAEAPGERFDRLRTLGDGVLYGCGFFGEHFAARGVEQRYLIGIGTTAYDNAGSMLRRGSSPEDKTLASVDIFAELATKFAVYVEVLADVAESTMAMGSASSKSVVKLYERWLKTGSDRLAEALSAHGLVPTRGSGGVIQ